MQIVIDTNKIIPKASHINTKIQITKQKKSLKVFWKNKGGGQHPKPVRIPKRIYIDENFLAIMGFFFGDGLKSNKGAASRTLAFTNSEPNTVKWAIKLFQTLGIMKKRLKASVSARGDLNKESAKLFWSKITKIPKEQISVNIRPSLSKGIRNLPEIKKYGAIKIEIYSAVLRDITINLLKISKMISLKSKKNAMAFLQGLLAAEGCPVINHGKLVNVVISCQNEKDKRFIEMLIKKCNMIHRLRKDGIEIHKNNFNRFKNSDIFKFHTERQERFLNALKLI